MDPSPFRPAELARQHDFLCRLARGLLGDAARAEDVVQEAYVLALERPPRAARALPAWLGRVVRRLSLNELRRAERSRRHERAAARPEGQTSHVEASASLEAQHHVLAAVRALEEPYRTTIWLRYYENLLPGAIAARDGVPVKTVKTRLSRALERLRAELERSSGGDRASWGALLLPLARRSAPGPLDAGPGILGGMLAMKKLVAALAVLALALLTWRVAGTREPGPPAGARVVALGTEERGIPGAAVAEVEPRSPARERPATGGGEADREQASAGATLVVHAVFERDGTDAAGIQLAVVPEPRSDLGVARAPTDAGGRARFEGLAPGAFSVHTDRGGVSAIELPAGATEELELVVASGVDVAGVVVDGAGERVPGAEIWLSRLSRFVGDGWLAGEVVARADGGGAFLLRSVGPRQAIGAFAPGFAPAPLEELKEKSWSADEPRVELTVVLERAGALLEGRVVDEQGAPVPGATVAFGHAGMSELPRADGRLGHGPTPRTVQSDALGRFRADWLEPGPTPVFVLADGFALARHDATASSAGAEPVAVALVVALTRGATIAGTVRDSAGQPVPGVEIRVLHAGDLDSCPFQLPKTTSSAAGAFQLEHVPAGEVTLSARSISDSRLRTRAARTLAEGAAETWDLVLETAPSITGRALDGAGRGLAHWTVMAGSGAAMVSLETDDEGRFVMLVRDPAEAWTLSLVHAGVAHDMAENVHAGDEVELLGLAPEELGRVEGSFADVAARVPEGERVFAQLVSEASASRPRADLVRSAARGDGRFLFEGVTPGRYSARVQTANRVLAESEAFELAPGAALDLGLLRSRAAGSLVVDFVAPAGTALPDGCTRVWTDAGGERVLVRKDGAWRADDLDPGRGALTLSFPGLAWQQRGFEVQEGSETRLSVVLERGVERTLSFALPAGATCPSADVLVRGDSWELFLPAFGTDRLEVTLTLAPGSYEVEARTASGLGARGVLAILDLSRASERVAFELR